MKLNRTIALILAFLAVFTMAAALNAQTKDPISAVLIKAADGYLYIYNTKIKSFMLEIKGKDVTTPKNDAGVPMLFVNGKVVQMIVTETTNFVPAGKTPGEDEILELHKKWESDFLGGEYKSKLQVESEKLSLGDRKTLFWGFKRPGLNETFDRDYFLTTTFGMTLLAVGSPIKPNEELSAYKTLLTEIMSTLKVSSEPFDIHKIADDLRKSAVKNK
jgi:hypothetical protein